MEKFSPKLKAAMKEIENIMVKNDIGGICVLSDKDEHNEYRIQITQPSWSMLRDLKDKDGNHTGIHIKAHMKSNKEETLATVNMVSAIRDLSASVFKMTDDIFKRLGDVMEIEVTNSEHYPHK